MNPLHTAGNAVPSVDGTELGDALDDLANFSPAIDLHRDAIRLTATERHTADQTQTHIATLAGHEDASVLIALALSMQRLASPDTNPCVRDLPFDRQEKAQQLAKELFAALTDPYITGLAANLAATLDPTT